MAWDPNRPIPWQRLIRDWIIYVSIMAVVFVLVYRDDLTPGPFVGLLISGPLFLGVGAVLAKFGYQRKTLSQMRTPRATTTVSEPESRRPPAPTRRTSGGSNRRPPSGRKRR